MKKLVVAERLMVALFIGALFACGSDEPISSGPEPNRFPLPGGTILEMVKIESGSFVMGSPDSEPNRSPDEGPQKNVTISQPFFLGRTEVTQAQWESVMGTRPWEERLYTEDGPEFPAVYISWNDAQAFIEKLNTFEGKDVYRLPTEAEWEYACRAGTVTRWSCGDDLSRLADYAWYYDGTERMWTGHPREVGLKLPNPWGLYDIHGNVREFVQDWYQRYYSGESELIDPTGPATGEEKVVRGGYWRDEAIYLRSAMRLSQPPTDWTGLTGLRVLREIAVE